MPEQTIETWRVVGDGRQGRWVQVQDAAWECIAVVATLALARRIAALPELERKATASVPNRAPEAPR